MTLPLVWLQTLIYLATALVALAPVVLLGLWLRDLRKGRLW